jgi:hypothetical protein
MIEIKLGIGTTQINLDQIKIWIKALRSGEFAQTHGRLQDKHGYCCIGVGCKVLIPTENQVLDYSNRYLVGGNAYLQSGAPPWLLKINKDFEKRYGKSLITLNDTNKLSFSQIADLLEQIYITPYESTGDNIQ